jgi:hypothetical protein
MVFTDRLASLTSMAMAGRAFTSTAIRATDMVTHRTDMDIHAVDFRSTSRGNAKKNWLCCLFD